MHLVFICSYIKGAAGSGNRQLAKQRLYRQHCVVLVYWKKRGPSSERGIIPTCAVAYLKKQRVLASNSSVLVGPAESSVCHGSVNFLISR